MKPEHITFAGTMAEGKESRVVYFNCVSLDSHDYDVAVDMIFIVGESVARVKAFGCVDQAGDFVPLKMDVETVGMTLIETDEAQAQLVTDAIDLINHWAQINDGETMFHDPLTIQDLELDEADIAG